MESPVRAPLRRVAAFLPPSHYGRELTLGIARYARERGGWMLYVEGGATEPVDNLPTWRGDGAIAYVGSAPLAAALRESAFPVVNVSSRQRTTPSPRVAVDNVAAGKVAAEHLLERGFKHLGFVSFHDHHYADLRMSGFFAQLAERGIEPLAFCQPTDVPGWSWEKQQRELIEWVASLPRPCAVAACSDIRAQHVMAAIRSSGLRTPEDIALIGFDDDPLLCELSDPPLSSVATNFDQVGYVAASLLDRMMNGESVAADTHITVPPGRVTVRRSTDVFAVDDPEVADAMRFIRARATHRVRVSDVLEAMPMSRRNLERRFVRVLGRTIFDDIRLAQLERAKQLLLQTDWPVYRVATEAGFNDSKHLALEFGKHLKQTPLAFRKAHRPDAPEHRGRR